MEKNQKTIENQEELEEKIPELDENGHYVGELGPNVTPFVRMITDIYSKLHYIEEWERRGFAQSLTKPSKNPIVQKINNFFDTITESKVGALFCVLLVKIFGRWLARLEYVSEEEELKANAKKALLKETLADLVPDVDGA